MSSLDRDSSARLRIPQNEAANWDEPPVQRTAPPRTRLRWLSRQHVVGSNGCDLGSGSAGQPASIPRKSYLVVAAARQHVFEGDTGSLVYFFWILRSPPQHGTKVLSRCKTAKLHGGTMSLEARFCLATVCARPAIDRCEHGSDGSRTLDWHRILRLTIRLTRNQFSKTAKHGDYILPKAGDTPIYPKPSSSATPQITSRCTSMAMRLHGAVRHLRPLDYFSRHRRGLLYLSPNWRKKVINHQLLRHSWLQALPSGLRASSH